MTVEYSPPTAISQAHDTTSLRCGRPALDRWLRRHALANEVTGRSRTFVVTPVGSQGVVAYYCLSASIVEYAAATSHAVEGLPGGEPIPAVLLGRLAVDAKHQGGGLGSALLRDAVRRTYMQIARNAGVRVMLVHAKDDEAAQFYVNHGFEPSPSDELHLMLVMQDIEKTFRRG